MGIDTVHLDVLEEIDGPMLLHGLQGFQGRRIQVPRADRLKPNRDLLAECYGLSSAAGAERRRLDTAFPAHASARNAASSCATNPSISSRRPRSRRMTS